MLRSRKVTSAILLLALALCSLYLFNSTKVTHRLIENDPSLGDFTDPLATGRNLASFPQTALSPALPPSQSLRDLLSCHDRAATQRYGQRGDYWVLHNYVPASQWFGCADSVTYTTHGDHTFLDNLAPLLLRWEGPVSMAVFAPGTDFNHTITAIQYARLCGPHAQLVRDLVTFHIYFPNKHVPTNIPRPLTWGGTADHLDSWKVNCSEPQPWQARPAPTYRTTHKVLYPVNVGRNVAREEAVTHFVLASDVELYPNPGVIKDFLAMVRVHAESGPNSTNSKVYPLSIFELKTGTSLPMNKTQLVKMLKTGAAVPFHKHVCPHCHNVPKAAEWIALPQAPSMHVFHVGRRTGTFLHWEPIYIGTHAEPLYDERLSWEGQSDKMTQGYAMCVMDYEFHILDNAFLVHRPGIKFYHKDKERELHVKRTQVMIRQQILPELKLLYGTLKGCTV